MPEVLRFESNAGDLVAYRVWGAQHKNYTKLTIRDYAANIGRAMVGVPGGLNDAGLAQLILFYDSLKPTPSCRRNMRSGLISYYQFRIYLGAREDNPALYLPVWKPKRGVPNPIENDEAARLIEAGYQFSPMFGTLITLALHTGLRRTELVERRWQDVRGNTIRLVSKGGDTDLQPLNSTTVAALAEWRVVCPSVKWLFPSPRKACSHISGEYVYQVIRTLGESVGIDGARPHRLRHTFATNILEVTGDITTAQQALRHKDLKNTQRYARLVKTKVLDAAEQLRFEL